MTDVFGTTGFENDQLESMIDRAGLGNVLAAISEICYAKADHIQTNWQDPTLAHTWEVAGNHVGKAARFAEKM